MGWTFRPPARRTMTSPPRQKTKGLLPERHRERRIGRNEGARGKAGKGKRWRTRGETDPGRTAKGENKRLPRGKGGYANLDRYGVFRILLAAGLALPYMLG